MSLPPVASKGPYTIGFVQIGQPGAWRNAETQSVQDEAKKRNHYLLLEIGHDAATQRDMIRRMVSRKVNAIILAPIVRAGWKEVLKAAADACIPVVLLDRGIDNEPGAKYETLISSDFTEEGALACKWLAKRLDWQGDVVEIEGLADSDPAIGRKLGFEQQISEYPEMRIVAKLSSDFSYEGGKQSMEEYLKTHPNDFAGVYAHSDAMALGAIEVIEKSGRHPGKDVIIASIDGSRDALKAVKENRLGLTIECTPLLGYPAMEAVERALQGQKMDRRLMRKDKLFDLQNVDIGLRNARF